MANSINTSLSGLAAAGKRLEVAANNIANQNSTQSNVNGVTTNQPYIPQDVVQISLGASGVRAEVRDAGNPTVKRYDPESAQAGSDGLVSSPNVDQAEQMVNMMVASYDYKANLKAIKVADNLQQYLLDITG